MTPLPAAVLAALAICSHHWGSASWDGSSFDLQAGITACVSRADCGPDIKVNWNVGYELCSKVYDAASVIQQKREAAEEAAAEAAKERKALAAAKKDHPALIAALKALGDQ